MILIIASMYHHGLFALVCVGTHRRQTFRDQVYRPQIIVSSRLVIAGIAGIVIMEPKK